MRRYRTLLAAVLALALTAGLLGSPAPAAPKVDGQIQVSYTVETDHGAIYVEAIHPTSGDNIVKGPAILTYSPYSILGRNGDAARWVPKGIHRIYADVVGTGNSGGCWDYGGIREKETGYKIVEWIAKQDWSSGKVAMMGASYDGTTATATAVMRPPHLTTIVPQVAIVRWYDYAFSGGIRYFLTNEMLGYQGPGAVTDEGFDTPLAFDFGLAIPPPVDAESEDWADRVQSTIVPCDELEHTQRGYDDTPDYDKFWLERDYLKDAPKVQIPVLVSGNWGDWNVKQEESWLLYNALKKSEKRVLYMGSRWNGHGLPGGEYNLFVDQWMDHYLLGKNNGIDKAPSIVSETADKNGETKWTSYKKAPKVRNVTLYAQNTVPLSETDWSWKLMPRKPQNIFFGGPPPAARFPSTNINTESHAAHHGRSNHDWYWFESPILKKDLRLFGSIQVQVYWKAQRKWITLTPSILDVNPGDHTTVVTNHVLTCTPTDPACSSELLGVTRGWLDSRYRKGLDKQVEAPPGEFFQMAVTAKPQDYTFLKGHYIGLNIQTEINEWSLPKIYPGCENVTSLPTPTDCADVFIDWLKGRTRLVLPVVNPPKNLNKLFDIFGGHDHG